MEKYTIKYDADGSTYEFLVGQFPFRDGETCKYSVFYDGNTIASFEPDRNNVLNICKNNSGFNEEILGQLADEIEYRHPNVISCSEE